MPRKAQTPFGFVLEGYLWTAPRPPISTHQLKLDSYPRPRGMQRESVFWTWIRAA